MNLDVCQRYGFFSVLAAIIRESSDKQLVLRIVKALSRYILLLKSEAEHSHTSTTQSISPSGSQSIDGSITQFFLFIFSKASSGLTLYI